MVAVGRRFKMNRTQRRLRLEWIFGYKSDRFRNNLHYNCNGQIVYYVGVVGVVLDVRQNEQRYFIGHSTPITCLCLEPRFVLAATGGEKGVEENAIFIWDTCTTNVVCKLSSEKMIGGVSCVAFSSSGALLGCICCDPNSSSFVFVWNWLEGRILSTCYAHSSTVLHLLFNPVSENEFVTCGVKHIKFWRHSGNSLKYKRGRFGHAAPIQTLTCLSFAKNGNIIYSGSLSGDIYAWKENHLQRVICNAHTGAVISIDSSSDSFVSGGKDGFLTIWDSHFQLVVRFDLKLVQDGYQGLIIRSVCCSNGKILIGTLRGEILEATSKGQIIDWILRGHGPGVIHALDTHPRGPLFASAGQDCTIRLCNYVDKRLVVAASTHAVVRCCHFHPDGDDLAIGFIDGSFQIVCVSDLSRIVTRSDQTCPVTVIKYSPNAIYLGVAYDNGILDIYHVLKGYHRVNRCSTVSSFPIKHLDWSVDSIFIQANDSLNKRFLFVAPDGEIVNEEGNIKWSSWTCTSGSEVEGILCKHSDETNIVTADVCFKQNLLVVGDCDGFIKLFPFPVRSRGSKCSSYVAHSGQVRNVRFSFDKSRVITSASDDQIVCQWIFDDETQIPYEIPGRRTECVSDESDSDADSLTALDSDVEMELRGGSINNVINTSTYSIPDECTTTSKPKVESPDFSLIPRYVFGYRGFDCRNNLVCTQNGQIVYFAGSFGIILDCESGGGHQRFYQGHTNKIISLCLHPKHDIVATAQFKDEIHIWSCASVESICMMSDGHKVAICCLDFSHDGFKLISLAVDSSLVVWDWKKGIIISSISGRCGKILSVKWNPHDSSKFVTVGVKHMKIWQQTASLFVNRRGIFQTSPPDTLLCIAFGRSDTSFVTGGSSGRLFMWEENVLIRSVQSHTGPIFCLHSVHSGFISGGKDGSLCLWDEYIERRLHIYLISNENLSPASIVPLSYDKPAIRSCFLNRSKIFVGTKNNEILQIDKNGLIRVLVQGHASGCVSGLCVHPIEDRVITVGYDSFLRTWNLSSGQCEMIEILPNPASSVSISSDGLYLAVGFLNGSIFIFNVTTRSASLLYKFSHRNHFVSDVQFSPDAKYLSVAYDSGFIDVYHVHKNTRIGVCNLNGLRVYHVDWDWSSQLIRADCGGGKIVYFESPSCKNVLHDMSRVRWASVTCACDQIIGAIDKNEEIAAIHANGAMDSLASATKSGSIHLYRYPLDGKKAKLKKYGGIYAVNLKWTHDGRHLVATDGVDGTIVVWHRGGQRSESAPDSDLSSDDDDEEEEDGYDSDVEREKNVKYDSTLTSYKKYESKESDYYLNTDGPNLHLHLNHVHGYGGFNSRNNAHYINDGSDIIYSAARLVIIQNLTTGIQSFYLGHTHDVTCLSVCTNKNERGLVASGDDQCWIHIWNFLDLITLTTLHSLSALVSLHFSRTGQMLVSVTRDRYINVWNWSSGSCVATCHNSLAVFDARFYPDSDSRFVSVGVKRVKFWQIFGTKLIAHRGRPVEQTFLSLAFTSNEIAITGSCDGSIFIWREKILFRIVTQAHQGPIFSLYNSPYDSLIVSGGKEAESPIKLWDSELKRCKPFRVSSQLTVVKSICRYNNKILVGTNTNSLVEIEENTSQVSQLVECHNAGSINGLCVHPEKRIFASTGQDSSLRVWDLDSNRLLANLSLPSIGLCIDWSGDGHYISLGLSNGELLVFNWSTLNLHFRRRSRDSPITKIKFSPDSSVLALAYSSGFINLISAFEPFSQLFSFSFSLTIFSIDFSSDSSLLRICVSSPSFQCLIVSVSSGQFVSSSSPIHWSTWSNWFVNELLGIWPRRVKSSVNCISVNNERNIVATGESSGNIKLFNFPSCHPFAKYNKYNAHNQSVNCVRFTHDDCFLVSAGSSDACLMVWRCAVSE